MAALVEINLKRNSFLLQNINKPGAVAYHYIPVVESVSHQCGCPVSANVIHKVALSPEIVVVARFPVMPGLHHTPFYNTVAVFTVIGIGMYKIVQYVNIFAQIASRTADKAVRTVIMVIRIVR